MGRFARRQDNAQRHKSRKNYLSKEELDSLGRLVNSFLDIAEDFAHRRVPMTMQDWATRLNDFLRLTGREVLQNAGTVSREDALLHAESEFEKYRIVQDKLYKSDFDKLVEDSKKK